MRVPVHVSIEWPAIAGDVAEALLGKPTRRTRRELRFGRRGSMSVDLVHGRWFDYEAGEGGGVLDLVERERNCDRPAAMRWVCDAGFFERRGPAVTRPGRSRRPRAVETENPANAEAHAVADARYEDSGRFARRVWTETRSLAGTIAAHYLEARGVGHVAGAPALRCHPALSHPNAPGRLPGMVASVQDVAGRFLGVQRTFLAPDGSGKAAVDPVRASLGSLRGGAVRLAESIGDRLLVGEGIETTAAAALVLNWRGGAWATLGTSGLRAVEIPPGVRHVVIAADRDAGGLRAAVELARKLEGEGRAVEIRAPCRGDFADWLDEAAS